MKIVISSVSFCFGMLALATLPLADGYSPGQAGYKDSAYVYQARPSRAFVCPPELRRHVDTATCKRIWRDSQAGQNSQAAAAVLAPRWNRVRDERSEPRLVRDDRRRDRDESERGPRNRCGAPISAEGKLTWRLVGESAAKREARLQWAREVISKDGYSERWADPEQAQPVGGKNGPGYSCWNVKASRRCSFTARPCKA